MASRELHYDGQLMGGGSVADQRRLFEQELKAHHLTWNEVIRRAADRQKSVVDTLRAT